MQRTLTELRAVDGRVLFKTKYYYMQSDKRKNERYQSQAKARIEGADCGEILLKDISIIGCCLASAVNVNVKSGNRYEIEVIPEEAADIGKFKVITESKWIHAAENSTELGFAILESPKGKQFQRYVDYLAWRSETGVSGGESSGL